MILGKGEGGAPAPDRAPATALGADAERITLDELRRLQAARERVWLLDVRTERTYNETDTQARGAIRLSPEGNVAARAAELALPRHDWLVAYCA